jgi:hypothetical protein
MKNFILCLAILIFSAMSADIHADDLLTIDSLSALIEQKQISSVEALLPELPKDFRSHTIYVYDSQSTQYADALNPRAILSSRDSNVVMAIESGSAPDSQRIELIQFDPKRRAFDFFEGTFEGGKPALILPRTDCARCHREDMRPNWQAYFHWAGVYGSDDNSTTGSLSPPNEDTNFQSFVAKIPTDPRYQWLSQADSLKENQDFTETQAGRNFARVARLLSETPNFAHFKYAYLGALLCQSQFSSFLPDSLKASTVGVDWNVSFERPGEKQKNPLYFLFDLQGLRWEDYSMSFKPSQSSFDPYFTTPYQPLQEFAFAIQTEVPEVRNMLLLSNVDNDVYSHSQSAIISDADSCNALAIMSAHALKDFVPDPAPTKLAPPAMALASLQTCISCHVGSAQLAPRIPFDDEIALKKSISAADGYLYQEILKRTAQNAPQNLQMPPKGDLPQTDRETIRSYINMLMR